MVGRQMVQCSLRWGALLVFSEDFGMPRQFVRASAVVPQVAVEALALLL